MNESRAVRNRQFQAVLLKEGIIQYLTGAN